MNNGNFADANSAGSGLNVNVPSSATAVPTDAVCALSPGSLAVEESMSAAPALLILALRAEVPNSATELVVELDESHIDGAPADATVVSPATACNDPSASRSTSTSPPSVNVKCFTASLAAAAAVLIRSTWENPVGVARRIRSAPGSASV
jgi:hypothetical protein